MRTILRYFIGSLVSFSLVDIGVSVVGRPLFEIELTLGTTLVIVFVPLGFVLVLLGLLYGFLIAWYWRRWGAWFGYELRHLSHLPPELRSDFESEPEPPEPQYLTVEGAIGLPAEPADERKRESTVRFLITATVGLISVWPSIVGFTLLQITTPLEWWASILIVNVPLAGGFATCMGILRRAGRIAREGDADEAERARQAGIPHDLWG